MPNKKECVMDFYSNRIIIVAEKEYKINPQDNKYIWMVRIFTILFVLLIGLILRNINLILILPVMVKLLLDLGIIFILYKLIYYPLMYLVIPKDYKDRLIPYEEKLDISKRTGKGRK